MAPLKSPSLKRSPGSDLSPPAHHNALPTTPRSLPGLPRRPARRPSPTRGRPRGWGSGPSVTAGPASPDQRHAGLSQPDVAGGPGRSHEPVPTAHRRSPRPAPDGRQGAVSNSRLYSAISLLSAVPAIVQATAAPSVSPQLPTLPPEAGATSGSPWGHRSASGAWGACAVSGPRATLCGQLRLRGSRFQ